MTKDSYPKKANKIYMFWYKPQGYKNFGDELGPYLVSKLSGARIIYISIPGQKISKPRFLLSTGYRFIKGDLLIEDVIGAIRSYFIKGYLVTVGSILQFNYDKSAIIWGSGIISENTTPNPASFIAVRGEKTRKRLLNLGYNVPEVMGDPAILLPCIYKPKSIKKHKVGIIPHVIHSPFVKEKIKDKKIKIISLESDRIEEVIDEICSCEMIVSSSLHGIIVSHAYGIPCLWVDFPGTLAGDGVKFDDYFSSVGINEYEPFLLKDFGDRTLSTIEDMINKNKGVVKPCVEMKELQNKLLQSAPFELLNKYKNNLY